MKKYQAISRIRHYGIYSRLLSQNKVKRSKALAILCLLFSFQSSAYAVLFQTDTVTHARYDGIVTLTSDTSTSTTGSSTPGVSTLAIEPNTGFGGSYISSQGVANAGLTGLKTFSDVSLINNVDPTTIGSIFGEATSTATLQIDDLMITGVSSATLNTVTADFILHVSGQLIGFANHTGIIVTSTATVSGTLNGTAFSGTLTLSCNDGVSCAASSSGFLNGVTLSTSGAPFGLTSPSMNGDFTVITLSLPVGSPVSLSMTMQSVTTLTAASTSLPFSGNMQGNGQVDFRNTVAFPSNGDVLVLPTGFTANSASGGIVNNRATGVSINANTPPTATPVTTQTGINAAIQGQLLGSDANNDPLTFSMVQNGLLGSAVMTNATTGLFTYTPQLNITGTDTLTFQVDDGNGSPATATLTVTIVPTTKIDLLNLGDMNGDGLDDIGIVEIDNNGVENVVIKSAVNGLLLGHVTFGNAFTPLSETVLPDINGNGAPEIAVIGVKIGGTTVRANVLDASTGSLVKNVFFNPSQTPLRIGMLNDISGNGVSELLLLSTAVNGSGAIQVQIKDALSGSSVGAAVLYFGNRYDARAFEVLPDMNGNGFPEVGVMGRHSVSGLSRVQIRDTGTGNLVRQSFFNPNWVPESMKQVPDMDGNRYPELALISTNPATNNGIQIQLSDSFTGASQGVVFYGNSDTFIDAEVIPDTNGNGFAEIAVLGVNKSNGNVRVQSKDAGTQALLQNTFFNKNFAPTRLIILGDLTGNGQPELGVLGTNSASTSQVELNDTSTNNAVNTITMP